MSTSAYSCQCHTEAKRRRLEQPKRNLGGISDAEFIRLAAREFDRIKKFGLRTRRLLR